MSYAIVQTGGKQYRFEPGRFYDVEKINAEPGESFSISDVLLVNMDGNVSVGQPLVDNASVEVTVMQHRKAKKVIVYKMQPKKKTRSKNGHRQVLTRLMVQNISHGGKTAKAATPEPVKVSAEAAETVTAEVAAE
ncbi:LSU ribosomal protein L21P [Thalassoporum mexicanum PCC 7367]|uniref:50S ribosomal protein L21 n=1 Tax=Thalassoporum mexicanum TaxID=3457544 RepID=UPI00029FE652|nr:50S ribosomal protein L21 [Pseudanabaena sp. PCC 7367]AFY68815.1 LSU ribosomal protein L21P [Pseudanabaena sp. PCC 7367]